MKKKSPFLAELRNLDMEAVARVARKVELREIYLLEASVHRESMEIGEEPLSLKYHCATKILPSDATENILPVACEFSVLAFHGDSSDSPVMRIEASFCANYVFRNSRNVAHEDIQHFAKINPLYNVWSYWREFVHSMTTRMGFPALTVPLLTIVPKKSPAKRRKELAPKKPGASQG